MTKISKNFFCLLIFGQIFLRRSETTMKTSNYLAKLPQEATIKSIQILKDYDLISLDVPTASQRLCPHCGSNDCVIKDSGTLQTVRHIPCNHHGTVVSFHKRRLLCKDCHSSFYVIVNKKVPKISEKIPHLFFVGTPPISVTFPSLLLNYTIALLLHCQHSCRVFWVNCLSLAFPGVW